MKVEEDHIRSGLSTPTPAAFDVALIQDIRGRRGLVRRSTTEDRCDRGTQDPTASYEVGDRIITPLKTRDFWPY